MARLAMCLTLSGDEPLWRDAAGRRVQEPRATDGGEGDKQGDEQGEPPVGAVKQTGFRTHGKSKDHRDDLPQVVVGMAVTRDGIPVRVWCWPGNTSDSALIRQVKDDMRDWNLSRVVWVADRGFTSTENRRYLQRAGGGYILGEKLRSGSAEAAARARAGRPLPRRRGELAGQGGQDQRTRTVRDLPQPRGRRPRRRRPRSAGRTAHRADQEQRQAVSDQAGRAARGDLDQTRAEPVPAGHRRWVAPGRRRRDRRGGEAGRQVLLRTSDPHLSAEDIALGYKQLRGSKRRPGGGQARAADTPIWA